MMIEMSVFLFALSSCAFAPVLLFLCGGKRGDTDHKPLEKKKGKPHSIWDMNDYGVSTVDDQQIEGSKVQTISTPGTNTIMAIEGKSKVQTEVKPEKEGKADATKATTVAPPPPEDATKAAQPPSEDKPKEPVSAEPEKEPKADAAKAPSAEKPAPEVKPKVPAVVEPEKGPKADAAKAPPVAKPPPEVKPKVPAVVEPEKGPKADAPKAPAVEKPPVDGKPKVPAGVESAKGAKADAAKAPPVAPDGKPKVPAGVESAKGAKADAAKAPPVAPDGKPKVPAGAESAKGPKADAPKAPLVVKPPVDGKPKVPVVVEPAKGPKAVGAEHPQISVTLTVVKWEFLAGQDVFKVTNLSAQRVAFKLKTSDNNIYTVNPVSGFLEPGKTIPIVIIRKQSPFKLDKIECLAAAATANDKDAMDVFKIPNVKTETFTVKMERKAECASAKK